MGGAGSWLDAEVALAGLLVIHCVLVRHGDQAVNYLLAPVLDFGFHKYIVVIALSGLMELWLRKARVVYRSSSLLARQLSVCCKLARSVDAAALCIPFGSYFSPFAEV